MRRPGQLQSFRGDNQQIIMLQHSDLIAIGEVIKAQGIHGELKVMPLTSDPRRFGQVKRIYFQNQDGTVREFLIQSYRLFKEFILLKLTGIDDMNQALELGRGLICIPRAERPTLPPGQFYFDQIEGLAVYTVSGESLGVVKQILETGANHVYCVGSPTEPIGSAREILIPALKSVIKEISPENGRIVVELPPGLVEE